MFMPMMAMGVVLSVVAMIAVFGMVLKLNVYKLFQRLVTFVPGADVPRLDNKVCGRLPDGRNYSRSLIIRYVQA